MRAWSKVLATLLAIVPGLVCAAGGGERLRITFEGGASVSSGAGTQFATLVPDNCCSPSGSLGAGPQRILASPRFEFEGGTLRERGASVTDDPLKPGNRVLAFRLSAPNVPGHAGAPAKGRVQMNLYGNRSVRELRETVRLMLDPDIADMRSLDWPVNWLTLSEWWNNAAWGGQTFPFRITVGLLKPGARAGSELHFGVTAQVFDTSARVWQIPLWNKVADSFAVPVGRWIVVDYYYREGVGEEGRFILSAGVEGEPLSVLVDMYGTTRHPDDPSPDGLTHFNPLKLYTSARLINAMRSRGKELRVYWDDLDVRACAADAGAPTSDCVGLRP